jgi:transcriptional regulator with PAS, ATPase and Fis domain
VHEKCQTIYDDNEKPVRSIGTVQDITKRALAEHNFAGIIGKSAKMKEIFSSIRECADINIPVYIEGESGTGKELVAMAIHNESPRSNKPFVPVNCSALPEGLLESELFGHVKGSFTGAVKDRKGRFELARGGTLFLDEIADLTKAVQGKLLRVLQEGTFEQVGGEKTISADVRIISAANRDLKKEVKKGNFRDDLYYRINVIPISLPALRERKEDIPLLIDDFLNKALFEGQSSQGVSKEALAVIVDYAWPGNIRELQSAISYALIKSKGKMIRPQHLPPELQHYQSEQPRRGPSRKLDAQTVRDALVHSGGNKAKAARYLGVGRATLYRFLEDFPEVSKDI